MWFESGLDLVWVLGLVLVSVPNRKEGAVFVLWRNFCLFWEVQSLILRDGKLKTFDLMSFVEPRCWGSYAPPQCLGRRLHDVSD